jgi:hypothetical protein
MLIIYFKFEWATAKSAKTVIVSPQITPPREELSTKDK